MPLARAACGSNELVFHAGESTAILQSNLSKPSVDNRTPIPGRLKDCAEACHVDLQCGYFLWNATTDECTLHHTGKGEISRHDSDCEGRHPDSFYSTLWPCVPSNAALSSLALLRLGYLIKAIHSCAVLQRILCMWRRWRSTGQVIARFHGLCCRHKCVSRFRHWHNQAFLHAGLQQQY